jgi:putative addiction module component (TIGR02574 family)
MQVIGQEELLRLTPSERLGLISQLWDSLENEQISLSPAQAGELDRRLDMLETDRASNVTWESLRSELEQRCS